MRFVSSKNTTFVACLSHGSAIALLQEQRHLLQVEYQEEKEAYRLHTESMGLARKVMRKGDENIDHNFEYGKPAVCSSKTF